LVVESDQRYQTTTAGQWAQMDTRYVQELLKSMQRAVLGKLARDLGARPSASATKSEIIHQIRAVLRQLRRRQRMGKEGAGTDQWDKVVISPWATGVTGTVDEARQASRRAHRFRDQRNVEKEQERGDRPRDPVPVKSKKKSNKENMPTALSPHEVSPDPSSNIPAPVDPGAEFCNACNQRVNTNGFCGCHR
jgi:hypothetical protein